MAVLGKRKAPEPSVSQEDAAEIFRRHFETQFAPLPPVEVKVRPRDAQQDDNDDGDEDEDVESQSEDEEWAGLSDEDFSDGEEGMFFGVCAMAWTCG